MPWGAVASAVVGGVMGGGGSSSSQTTTNEIDPRLAAYIYGEDDKSGLLKDVSDWYQANKSGMNPQMAQGLNTQWAVLNDPTTMAGYQQMANLGSGLMGAPVMGNPFSDGRMSLNSGAGQAGTNLGLGSGGQQGGQQFPSFTRPTTAAPTTPAPGPFTATPANPPAPAPAPGADLDLPWWAEGQTPDYQGYIQHPNGVKYQKAPKGYYAGGWMEVPYGGNGG
ncbi:hypothetical protein [Pseudorhodoferax sp.]|uniref:hypothetical protein n=1 Tax=Pseudorhodoferax sp. TaxID=1993553 RepID=UPI002DD62552|nr:hypothetical protein [Pseudorhodoferax sp.]